jgi:general secretion pathway protein G
MEAITKTGRKTNKKWGATGYTLLEVMTVVAIVGILATLAVPTYKRSVIRAKESSLRQSLFVFRDVIDQYYADHGQYPDSLDDLAEKNYIREVPLDPFTKSRDTWVIIPPESSDESGAVYDVHSGSNKVSLHGTPYNEW